MLAFTFDLLWWAAIVLLTSLAAVHLGRKLGL